MTGKNPARLFVMVGPPASGKTTCARQIEVAWGALRLTPDEWMIPLFGRDPVLYERDQDVSGFTRHAWFGESEAGGKRDVLEGRFVWLAIRALSLGVNVVLDFDVWSRAERSALRYLASSVGATCELVYLEIDEAEQHRRIAARLDTQDDSTFPIAEDDLTHSRRVFLVPDRDELEGHEVGPPPVGYPTWTAWVSERWPTSIEWTVRT